MKTLVISIALCVACGNQKREPSSQEEYVAKEIADLRLAITARDETKITVGCMSATAGMSHLSSATISEIEQLCYEDVPRVLLELAVADAKKQRDAHMDHDLGCFQLFAEDALKWAAKRSTPAPAVAALAAEYEKLCPEKAAAYRARAKR